jgi:DNA primase
MISQTTIDAVNAAADIVDVIGRNVRLKRAGANHIGLCPFHDERTPSFSVSQAKGIYKCFGCNRGGHAVQFVMEHDKKSFPEAIEYLADLCGIAVEHDSTQAEQPQETRDKKQEMLGLLKWAGKKYEDALYSPEGAEALNYLHGRGYTDDRIKMWGIGFAPLQDLKFISSPIINMGKLSIAQELGITTTTEGISKDFLINRITVPIHDANGSLTGFAGRIYRPEDAKYPKWMNPRNSIMYNKGTTWYGLTTARRTIQQAGFAYLVEGYPDVHTMQDHDLENTIAPCGKEITPEQVKFLKRFTQHVCFVPNIDANESGQKAVLKYIDTFIAAGFRTTVVPLPECNDADEYINHLLNQKLQAV